ncbi:hypothetical protein ACRALDRAFT_1061263 [Sodiomyces alcalophilus JCM 7366]|uniref:uncharacterized protein n=1 Tax=Sodiomyces alcalophilus JCM 7366 TaxID=591952 RepID=UPI0039B58E8B
MAPAMSPPSCSETATNTSDQTNSVPTPKDVFLVLWRDDESGDFAIIGVYSTIADANIEAHRMGHDHLANGVTWAPVDEMEPLRWDTAEGVSCWVEQHAVK